MTREERPEPVNNFWTLAIQNYCCFLLLEDSVTGRPLQNLPKIVILGKIAKKVGRGESLKTINASRY